MTLYAFHNDMVNAIKANVKLADDSEIFQTAEFYSSDQDDAADPDVSDKTERPKQEKIVTPAVIMEVDDMEQAEDQSTDGTLNLDMRCRVRVIASFKTGRGDPKHKPQIKMRELAARVALEIRRFTASARAFRIYPGDLEDDFDLEEYMVWIVEFTHAKVFGESVFQPEDINITTVCVGLSPEIGPDHVDDYITVIEPE